MGVIFALLDAIVLASEMLSDLSLVTEELTNNFTHWYFFNWSIVDLLYIENPKDATRKLLEFISESGKAAAYKINIQKSVAFLYTDNKISEIEIKETLPFTIISKRIKYLGINLLKGGERPVLQKL